MKATRTSTPWYAHKSFAYCDRYAIRTAPYPGNPKWDIARVYNSEDAKFIVRACNAHDELLEACRTAIKGFKTAAFRDPDQAGLYDAYEKPIRTAIAKATGE